MLLACSGCCNGAERSAEQAAVAREQWRRRSRGMRAGWLLWHPSPLFIGHGEVTGADLPRHDLRNRRVGNGNRSPRFAPRSATVAHDVANPAGNRGATTNGSKKHSSVDLTTQESKVQQTCGDTCTVISITRCTTTEASWCESVEKNPEPTRIGSRKESWGYKAECGMSAEDKSCRVGWPRKSCSH